MTVTSALAGGFDLLPEIVGVVRDAIKDGLITSETTHDFNLKVASLKGTDLEDYLQTLWDDI